MTRAAHFIPICESMDAPKLAQLYLDRIFRHHGFPQAIISDRGSIFVSSFLTQLMKICGVKMKPSTAFHPQTDGLTECTNQTLETYFCAFCSYQQDDWVDYLALAEFVFNNTINSSLFHSANPILCKYFQNSKSSSQNALQILQQLNLLNDYK
jgi:hypothetical protein